MGTKNTGNGPSSRRRSTMSRSPWEIRFSFPSRILRIASERTRRSSVAKPCSGVLREIAQLGNFEAHYPNSDEDYMSDEVWADVSVLSRPSRFCHRRFLSKDSSIPTIAPRYWRCSISCWRGRQPQTCEARFQHADGSIRWIHCIAEPELKRRWTNRQTRWHDPRHYQTTRRPRSRCWQSEARLHALVESAGRRNHHHERCGASNPATPLPNASWDERRRDCSAGICRVLAAAASRQRRCFLAVIVEYRRSGRIPASNKRSAADARRLDLPHGVDHQQD